MNGFTFAPALGWPAGIALCALMLVTAACCVAVYARSHAASDQTLPACIRRTTVCMLVAILALTPSTVIETNSKATNTTDVVVAVDVTGSMAVEDARYGSNQTMTRLDAARHAVSDLTTMYANSSFAAVSFGASATLDVPLTPDRRAIDNWADTLKVEPTKLSAGSSLDAPIDRLLIALRSIRQQHPDDAIILYVITDGEQTSSKTRRSYSSLRAYIDDAFTVGAGSTQGGPVPYTTDGATSDPERPWVIDPSTGKPGISKLNEKTLREIADELGGSYVALGASSTMRNGDSAQRSEHWRITQTSKERQRLSPITWPFALAITALLIWEVGAWLATNRKLL